MNMLKFVRTSQVKCRSHLGGEIGNPINVRVASKLAPTKQLMSRILSDVGAALAAISNVIDSQLKQLLHFYRGVCESHSCITVLVKSRHKASSTGSGQAAPKVHLPIL